MEEWSLGGQKTPMVTAEDSRVFLPPPSYPRQKIFKERALPDIENYMFETHDQLRQAATECMCNMVLHKEVQERSLADGNDWLKLVVLLCGEDDDKVQNAAAGALAMLTAAHKKLCLKMTQVVRAGPGDRKGWVGSRKSPHPQTTLDDPLGRPAPKETPRSPQASVPTA
ncbi:protein unc-45 homolog B-like [Nomascus leucogenys]|uniref:protein unc-45 homolog B-like n=1 Tax=Nomascus leucogenys TaxID=61853 RepID=UPI00122D90B1|nr:protein unc-45 homolog B-like [Nomascus leucogenys]